MKITIMKNHMKNMELIILGYIKNIKFIDNPMKAFTYGEEEKRIKIIIIKKWKR